MRLWIIFLFMAFSASSQDCDSVPPINKEIVRLAKAKLKKKVGTGECWDLAQYVLNETNAVWDKFEVYGVRIDPSETCILPGDIIQFEKIKLEWEEGSVTYSEAMQHHTAIVSAVQDDSTLVLIHQNTGQFGKKVGETIFRLNAIKKGKIYVYRPQAAD